MARHILKFVVPACVFALSAFSSRALAQTNIVPFESITPTPGLHSGPIIPLGTIPMRGRDIAPRGSASSASAAVTSNATTYAPAGLRFPGQLSFHGGPTLPDAASSSVFVNPTAACPPDTCWGDPIGFLQDLGASQFIHLVDQYVGETAPGRYTVGTNFAGSYPPSAGVGKPFTDQDMAFAAYFLAVLSGGVGLNHIYHIFLVPGQDVCFDSTFTQCYSPDNLNTFAFCAYHGSVSDSAGNVVLYSVEPYQDVPGCDVGPDTPNGQVADSTNNVLSHETIETITDPLGNAWWNSLDIGLFYEEIGDECTFVTTNGAYWSPSLVHLAKHKYVIQPEYSNAQHACSTGLDD